MDVFVELKALINDFQAKMAVVRGEMDATAKKGGGAFTTLGSGIAKVLGVTAIAAVGVGAASVKMAADFDSAMETIHTQAGASQTEVERMKGAVLGLAGPTATAPMALVDSLYHIESAGLRGAQALGVLKFAAEGAKIGHADLTDTTNALTAAVVSGIPGVQNFAQAMGALNGIVGSGDMKMQDLNEAFSTGIVVIAKQFGLTLNDVGAALATFGDNNIRGAEAGTKLRMAIMDLAKQAKPGAEALKSIGITTGELAKDMQSGGLNKALVDLKDHLDKAGITGVKVGGFLTETFTKKSAAPLAILIDQMGRFQSKAQIITQQAKGFGDDWKKTTETFAFRMQAVGTAAEAVGIRLGNILIPIILRTIAVTKEVIAWLGRHKQAAEDLGIAVISILVPAFISWAATAGAAAIATLVAAAPMIALSIAVAALGVGIFTLVTHWRQSWADIKQWTDDAVAWLRGRFGTLTLLILGPIAPLAILALHWQGVWWGIRVVMGQTAAFLLDTFRHLGDAFFTLVQGILSAGSHLPFVGHYFAEANRLVHSAHQQFDQDMTQWATDSRNFGNQIGQNAPTGIAAGLAAGGPRATSAAHALAAETVHQMHAAADGQGFPVGEGLSSGLAVGVGNAQNQAIAAANLLVSQTIHAMHLAAGVASPSTITIALGENMALGVIKGIENQQVAAMKAAGAFAVQTANALASPGGGSLAGVGAGAPGGWAAVAQQMAASMYGWTGAEWVALNNVAMRESGWNPNAQNPTSSAYGIAQNIGGRAGYPDPSPAGQIAWMLAYIKSRYGDPIGAWAHELSAGWYDRGGYLPPGLSLALNTTGKPEPVGATTGVTVNVYVQGSVYGPGGERELARQVRYALERDSRAGTPGVR